MAETDHAPAHCLNGLWRYQLLDHLGRNSEQPGVASPVNPACAGVCCVAQLHDQCGRIMGSVIVAHDCTAAAAISASNRCTVASASSRSRCNVSSSLPIRYASSLVRIAPPGLNRR